MTVDMTDEIAGTPETQEIWTTVQNVLKKRVPTATFNTWIQPLQLDKIEGDTAIIKVVNDFTREWILSKCAKDITAAFSEQLGREITLRVVVDAAMSSQGYTPSIASIAVAPTGSPATSRPAAPVVNDTYRSPQQANLNPKYTIDTFVVGSHNQFCYSAAMAVAERPGQSYNPLFIYGGVGLGKTHIMQAIGHFVMVHNSRLQVRYITCERFTNDLINSIRSNNMVDFRKRYRQVDVLLVDDIHFIEGKESTQEEFFHTFNALKDSGKQIVLSSDRPPKDIPKLEERLRSRFEWGLIADVQPPDLETRVAILRKKAVAERMAIPDTVLEYIANSFTSNIRELEGALTRVHAYASLTSMDLNISTVASVLQIGAPVIKQSTVTIEGILAAVAAYYRVDTSDLRSAKRSNDLAVPRHVAMFLAQDMLGLSLQRIGDSFGNRKHSSVKYAIDKVKEEMATSPQLAHSVQQIRRQLSN